MVGKGILNAARGMPGKPRRLVEDFNPQSCANAPAGSQEAVFCQVQKFPRIVVLPMAYGYLKTIEVNPCNYVGPVDQSCGFNALTSPESTTSFIQDGNRIVPVTNTSQYPPYNPNPPFPFVPPEQQIKCYNLASTLNQCNINKRNFYANTGFYRDVLGQST